MTITYKKIKILLFIFNLVLDDRFTKSVSLLVFNFLNHLLSQKVYMASLMLSEGFL